MQNMSTSEMVIKILIVIIILFLIVWCLWPKKTYTSTEGFKNSGEQRNGNKQYWNKPVQQDDLVDNSVPVQWKQEPIDIIQPPSYDAYTDTIQSGSDFIPQAMYYDTEGNLVKEGKKTTYGRKEKGLGDEGMNFNLCSPACCSDQWPVPFSVPVDKMTCQSEDEFVPTSYFCNNGWQDSGCLCLKKEQSDFIDSRGLNSDYLVQEPPAINQ
jgi:hypothetical protein